MSHATFVIEINLEEKTRPTDTELAEFGYGSEADYWIDLMCTDPHEMLNGATWEVVE